MRAFVTALSLLVVTSLAAAPPHKEQPDADKAKAVMARFDEGIAAFNRHDLDAFVDQFAEDVEMYTPTGWLRGRDAVRTRFKETFAQFPKVKMETDELRARAVNRETVVIDFVWRVYPAGAGPAFHGMSTGVYVKRGDRWIEVLEHEVVLKTDPALSRPRE